MQNGIRRELGQYTLSSQTQTEAEHVELTTFRIPLIINEL
jgi:hypothetical protein